MKSKLKQQFFGWFLLKNKIEESWKESMIGEICITNPAKHLYGIFLKIEKDFRQLTTFTKNISHRYLSRF